MSHVADARLPLYQQLRDALASRIARREWLPGDALPSEAEIAQSQGVAIGTVRKAVEQLVAEGLVERRQGLGTFVLRKSFPSSLSRFFRFQSESGESRIPHSQLLSRREAPASASVARALGLSRDDPVIALERLRTIDGAPFLWEDIWLPRRPFSALLDLAPPDFGDLLYPLYEERCGQVVASAEEILTVESADETDAARLALSPGAPLIVIARTALDAAGAAIEWRLCRGPASRFRYRVEIR